MEIEEYNSKFRGCLKFDSSWRPCTELIFICIFLQINRDLLKETTLKWKFIFLAKKK